MQKQEFVELLQNFIIPLFTGSELEGEEESSNRDAEVAQGAGGTILCKPNKNDEYRLIIKREQPFKRFEIQLVRAILEELNNVYKYNITEVAYKKSLQQYALEKAICKSISDKSTDTLLSLIYELSLWGNRTYEGARPTFGFIVSPKNVTDKTKTPIHFSKILSRDFSTMISDGINGVMFINSKGMLINYYNLPNISDQNVYAPFDYIKMAKACQKGRVGVTLINNGDLLIFSEGELVFAKRRGYWSSFSHDEIIQKISDKSNQEVQEAVYLSALDVSFAHTGACICYLRKEQESQALRHIDIYDILDADMYNAKLKMLKEDAKKSAKENDENLNANSNTNSNNNFNVDAISSDGARAKSGGGLGKASGEKVQRKANLVWKNKLKQIDCFNGLTDENAEVKDCSVGIGNENIDNSNLDLNNLSVDEGVGEEKKGCGKQVCLKNKLTQINHIVQVNELENKETEKQDNQIVEKQAKQDKQVKEQKEDDSDLIDYPDDFNEFLKSDKATKVCSLIKILSGKKFHELDRRLRADLLGIDGATVIDHDGKILCIGAIIEIEAGSSGGGRLAAAKTLGRYGVSMKVSMDSTITGFGYDAKKGRVKTLFFI